MGRSTESRTGGQVLLWPLGIVTVLGLLVGFLLDRTIAPLLTLAAGVAVAVVALLRHFAQTEPTVGAHHRKFQQGMAARPS